METQEIVLEYVPSAGATITENTNNEILCIATLIEEAPEKKETYKSWQSLLEEKGGFNTSNTRNICPLLENMGFLEYGTTECERKKFLTETGRQYVTVLKLADEIKKITGFEKSVDYVTNIKHALVYQGLKKMLLFSEASYSDVLIAMLRYLCRYGSIDKTEFYVLLSGYQKNSMSYLEDIDDLINKLRNNKVQIVGGVKMARGDSIQKGFSSITAYGYLIKLLEESGLVSGKDGRYFIVSEKIKWIENIISEVENE